MKHVTTTTASHIHFTGIKGVGMTATALCAQDCGASVSGSDVADTFVTDEVLRKRHLPVQIGFKPSHIPAETQLVIFTGAHQGRHNPEVIAAQSRHLRVISQAEAVGELMAGKQGISVCGVGGKSTTSAMIATILEHNQLQPSYLVGVAGINGSGPPGKYHSDSQHFVAEADEYVIAPGTDHTPRFMAQTPHIIVCTNIAHDHPDVYPSITETKQAFTAFFSKLPKDGLLVINGDQPSHTIAPKSTTAPIITYGQKSSNQFQLVSTAITPGTQLVTFKHKAQTHTFTLSVPGTYNALNALAAYSVCRHLKLSHQQISQGLTAFTGTKRRFEKIALLDGIHYYDDYAHHPSEIKAVLAATKQWLSNRRLIVIFQPHTYSRTKALFKDFAASFSNADQVIITDIFASARETADPSVSGKKLAAAIAQQHGNAHFVPSKDLVEYTGTIAHKGDILLTLGAGDIYKLHAKIIKHRAPSSQPSSRGKSS